MLWDAIDHVARSQLGLVTRQCLLGFGMTPKAIRWAVSDGRLRLVRPGVFRLSGVPLSQDQAWLAAVLAARGDAVLSHQSSAHAWGLRHFEASEIIHLLVAGASRPRMEGIRAHRTQRLATTDRTSLRRVPVTTAERTFVDSCGVLPIRLLGRSLDDAMRRRVISLPKLVRSFDGVPVSGRRKSGPMVTLLRKRVPGYDPGGSGEELNVLDILRNAGIQPLPRQQFRIRVEGRTYRVDYCWPDTKHILEYDGGGGHGGESARHDDRDRWRRLQRAGYTIWAVTETTSMNEIIAIGHLATS